MSDSFAAASPDRSYDYEEETALTSKRKIRQWKNIIAMIRDKNISDADVAKRLYKVLNDD